MQNERPNQNMLGGSGAGYVGVVGRAFRRYAAGMPSAGLCFFFICIEETNPRGPRPQRILHRYRRLFRIGGSFVLNFHLRQDWKVSHGENGFARPWWNAGLPVGPRGRTLSMHIKEKVLPRGGRFRGVTRNRPSRREALHSTMAARSLMHFRATIYRIPHLLDW